LKDVRQWQNPNKYHADSAEDCVSYAALKAEALSSIKPVSAGIWYAAPPQATHLLINGSHHKFAMLDGEHFRECDTQFVIDMKLWPIVKER